MRELSDWHKKDDEVKEMLNRKNRVDNIKNQSGNTLEDAINVIDKTRSSPVRKQTGVYSPMKIN